jgi:N-acetyl-anhydromuramyl-L-alanine amidase AmpD
VSILLLNGSQPPPVVLPPLPIDKREAANWQSRRNLQPIGVVEHIGVAPTFDSLVNYLRGANAPQVSATFVIGGDFAGQWALLVGSGLGLSLDTEKLSRAANHAGIQTWPNNNPLPQIQNPNWWTVGKEHVGYPGQIWTAAMTQNDIDCNEFIRSVLGSSAFTHILGHRDFDPINRANCPGPSFPWAAVYGLPVQRELRATVALRQIPNEKLEQLPVGDWDEYNKLVKEFQ